MFEQIALIFDELDFITANITTIILFLTLLSLTLANVARYAQAKKYGIPLKMIHQVSIPDSFDIWITLICVLGFGIVVPWAMQSAAVYPWLAISIITASCLLGSLASPFVAGATLKDKQGNIVRVINFKWIICALGILAFIYLHFLPTNDPHLFIRILAIVARILRGLYVFIFALSLITDIVRKIFGAKDILTVQINEDLYLIAMRHVHNFWVLIPCTMTKDYPRGNITLGGKKEEDKVDVITYIKGDFIVRDISLMDQKKTIHCYATHELRGITPPKN
ncbi:MAG: hypothetical protein FWC71_02355 [Defluviitaleaceae bacterium]|nr:hypothetical protein [Defluviitaleaceae bacterium]